MSPRPSAATAYPTQHSTMTMNTSTPLARSLSLILIISIAGCGSGDEKTKTGDAKTESGADGGAKTSAKTSADGGGGQQFESFSFGGDNGSGNSGTSQEDPTQSVIQALKPLQIMLGTWRGTTRKKFDGFNAVDETNWVFDFRTDRKQPALVMTSDKSPYVRSARLTYLTDRDVFQLQTTDEDGLTRTLEGTYSQEVEDKPIDGDQLQRTYKLQLTEIQSDNPDQWQVVFNQQENNRYLMEISRKRGAQKDFQRYDTVSTQREGTSFALSDTDYGERECIVSQGLGTIAVSFNGKSYYVCCTGCKAAFEDDPEHWLAKLAERMEEKEKK